MVRRPYFSHYSPSGATPLQRIRRTGYFRSAHRWKFGENIAWGSGARSTPRMIVRAWMESRTHRHYILKGAFRELGVGVVGGAPVRPQIRQAATYVHEFGAIRR